MKVVDQLARYFEMRFSKAPIAASINPLTDKTKMIIDRNWTILTASPALDPAQPEQSDRVLACYKDRDVQAAASAFKMKLDRLAALCAYRSSIATAVNFASKMGFALTPELVLGVLEGMSDDLDEEIAAARADHFEFDRAEKLARDRHRPLLLAVSELQNKLAGERAALDARADAMKRAAVLGVDGGPRYENLKAAGLSDEQVNKIGVPTSIDRDAEIATMRVRVQEIDALTARIALFRNDPLHDAAPIAGITPLIDSLVGARDGEQVAA
ncbi:MAG: hypothetical protein EOO27_03140 [Comamonadaceae bacterium]|nr:MAG: hypothetical protein EOO27_03140 [Comamonadaceae bacterium]